MNSGKQRCEIESQIQPSSRYSCRQSSDHSNVKPGSQYDAGAVNITSVVSVMEKVFQQSNCIPDVKFFDNLIGWTLANARNVTLE